MAEDFGFRLGLDDSKFTATITQAEGRVSRMAGQWAKSINASTAGYRALSGAIGSAVGIATGIVARVTVITGLIYAAVEGMKWLADYSERTARAAKAEQQARAAAAATLSSQRAALFSLGGGVGIRDDIAAESKAIAQQAEEMRATAKDRYGIKDGRAYNNPKGMQDLREYRGELFAIAHAEKLANDEARRRIMLKQSDSVTAAEANALEAQGQAYAAERLREAQRYTEAQRTINQLALVDSGIALRLIQAEEARHKAKLKSIDAAEREAKQKERTARIEEERAEFAVRLGIAEEASRLSGNETEAQRIRLLAEHSQKLQEINRLTGIDEATRGEFLTAEEGLYAMRLGALGKDAAGAGAFGPPQTRSAPTGLLNYEAISRAALGPGLQNTSPTRELQQKQVQAQQVTNHYLEKVLRSVRNGVGAVYQ